MNSHSTSNNNPPWLQIALALIALVSVLGAAWIANRTGVSTGQQQAQATASVQQSMNVALAITQVAVTQLAITQVAVTRVVILQPDSTNMTLPTTVPTAVLPTSIPPTPPPPQPLPTAVSSTNACESVTFKVDDYGLFSGGQLPDLEPLGACQVIFVHGDINNDSKCHVKEFKPGDPVQDLGFGTFRLVRITGSPTMIKAEEDRRQVEAARSPGANGMCPSLQ